MTNLFFQAFICRSILTDEVMFACEDCDDEQETFAAAIGHRIGKHPDHKIRVQEQCLSDKTGLLCDKILNFVIIPSQVRGFEIKVDEDDYSLLLIPGESHDESPKKKQCLGLANDSSKYQPPVGTNQDNLSSSSKCRSSVGPNQEDHGSGSVSDEEATEAFIKAIPQLRASGYLGNMVTFFSLVSKAAFPMGNISLQLFVDVVRWMSNPTTTQMRYSEDVKLFWKTGQLLFKGK